MLFYFVMTSQVFAQTHSSTGSGKSSAMVGTKQAQAKSVVEKNREELKMRLSGVKNVNKRNLVDRVDVQIQRLNITMQNNLSETIDKIEKVLAGVSKRAATVVEKGWNISSVKIAIVDAEKAIVASRAALQAQSGKVYTISVTTEETLKFEAKKTRELFHADLKVVQDVVKQAHEAVQKSVIALGQIDKGSNNIITK